MSLPEREYSFLTPISGGYLRSRSTRDQRLVRRRRADGTERIGIRVKAPTGITGGYVAGRTSVIEIPSEKRGATPARITPKPDRKAKIEARRNNVGRIAR
jgi:hypothetical protein